LEKSKFAWKKSITINQSRLTELRRVGATPVCGDFLKLAGFCATLVDSRIVLRKQKQYVLPKIKEAQG
jgi:hypothetical protein